MPIRTIYEKIPKEEIEQMPKVFFPGKIYIIETQDEVQNAVSFLKQFSILGLDTETRPSFKKGEKHKVSLLQLSTLEECFLFRLNLIDLPLCVIQLLSNPDILKVGLSLHDDISALKRRKEFTPSAFFDLQEYVKKFDIEDLSLQKIYANIFHSRISKRQRLTNWEAENLTESQKQYAAIDAWACIRLYKELKEIERGNNYHHIINGTE